LVKKIPFKSKSKKEKRDRLSYPLCALCVFC
jgi:hypothetical protein